MFEVYADKAEPAVRLVVPAGSGLPAELGPRDWLSLGPFSPDAATAEAVATHGHAFIRSSEPLPESARLEDSNAAGA